MSTQSWKKTAAMFLTGQSLSMFGSMLVQYAMMWHITLTFQSGIYMTIFIICGFLPTFFISPFAGVWADRFSKKTIIMLADGMIALSTLILAIIFMSGYEEVWLLFVMALIRGLGQGIHTPAIGAILPEFIPEDKLMRVNGIYGSIHAIIIFAAPIASAGLLSVTTLSNIFFIDVITAILAILTVLFFVHIPKKEKLSAKEEKISYLADFKLGLKYIQNHAFLKPLFIFLGLFLILMAPSSFLTPLQVARSFGEDVWRLTALEIVFSIGMMLGGILLSTWGGFKNRIKTMLLATFWLCICTALLGLIPNFYLYLAVMGLIGIGIPLINTPFSVLLQEKVDSEYIGRVFGIFPMVSTSAMPIGMLIFGPLSDTMSIENIMVITGVISLLVAFVFAQNKKLKQAGEQTRKKEAEAI